MRTTWPDAASEHDQMRRSAAQDERGGAAPARLDPRLRRSLEDALAHHVSTLASNRLERNRLDAVLDRLGLRGRPPLTLAEAGRVAGLSGERVRQLESRLRKQQATAAPAALPELDGALAAVARAVPLPAHRVPDVLRRAGLTRRRFSAESLLAAAELLGRPLPFAVSGAGPDAILLPPEVTQAATHTSLIDARARRQVERTGATTVTALAAELAEEGIELEPRHLEVVLGSCTSALVRDDGWFWFADPPTGGAFLKASQRMLAVTSPLPIGSLHDGLRRHNAFRRRPAPPPVDVLAEVYDDHPAFAVSDGMVSALEAAGTELLGPLNQRILEILRSAPGGMMARAPLLQACHDAGLNLTSVNLYTTYSECLERVGPGIFAARGTGDALGADAPRRTVAGRAGDEWPACGWTVDGLPWLAGRVTASTWANGVLHVPAELQPVLQGRHFRCAAAGATATLGVDHHGNSWGWTGFLRRSGAAPGDVVRATFDPESGTVAVEVLRGDPVSAA